MKPVELTDDKTVRALVKLTKSVTALTHLVALLDVTDETFETALDKLREINPEYYHLVAETMAVVNFGLKPQ